MGRRKRPAEFGPYVRSYCSKLEQPWPEGKRLRFMGLWDSVLLTMKRHRVDLREGWLWLSAWQARELCERRTVGSALDDLRVLSAVVELEVQIEASDGSREDLANTSREVCSICRVGLRSRNYLILHEVVPTFVDHSLRGRGRVSSSLGEKRSGEEGFSSPPVAKEELPGQPELARAPHDPIRLRMEGARFAGLVNAEETRRGLQPTVFGPATMARIGRWMADDGVGIEARARNVVQSRVNKPGAVSCDWTFLGEEERAACRWDGLRNGPVWGSDVAPEDDRAGDGGLPPPEAGGVGTGPEEPPFDGPVANPEEVRRIAAELAARLGWRRALPRTGRKDLAAEKARQLAELRDARDVPS